MFLLRSASGPGRGPSVLSAVLRRRMHGPAGGPEVAGRTRRATDRRHTVIVMHGLRTRRLAASVARTGVRLGSVRVDVGEGHGSARTSWME
jgi:hypothetical protein